MQIWRIFSISTLSEGVFPISTFLYFYSVSSVISPFLKKSVWGGGGGGGCMQIVHCTILVLDTVEDLSAINRQTISANAFLT